MTFDQIARMIQDREASCGHWAIFDLKLEQAKEKAADEILEGFENLDEARAWLETFRERQVVLFTGYGYEVSAEALEAAIRYREQEDI